jgi:hypothetical protein
MSLAKSKLDEFMAAEAVSQDTPDTPSSPSSPKRPLFKKAKRVGPIEPLTIKLDLKTRERIFAEVSQRKLHRLPNRTIQGVISDAMVALMKA